MKSYLSGDEKGSLGLEVVSVYLSKTGKSVDEAIKALVMAANRYQDEERKRPINYPDDVFGQFAKGCLNSNSWAQSLIEHTFGKGEVKEDMPGIDTCKVSRIDAAYFTTTASKYPVTKPTTTPEPKKAVAAKKTPKTYVVCVGDTLAGIAHKVYGNAKKWEAIYAANKGQIANPNLIRPGQKLVIPVDATY
jgi:phage tail protein X